MMLLYQFQKSLLFNASLGCPSFLPMIISGSVYSQYFATQPYRVIIQLRFYEMIYHRASFAKKATAFFNMSRSIVTCARSFFNLLISSSSGFMWPLPGNAFFASSRYLFFQLNNVFFDIPRSSAILAIDLSESKTSFTEDILNSLSKVFLAFLSDIVLTPIFTFINIVAFLFVYKRGNSLFVWILTILFIYTSYLFSC